MSYLNYTKELCCDACGYTHNSYTQRKLEYPDTCPKCGDAGLMLVVGRWQYTDVFSWLHVLSLGCDERTYHSFEKLETAPPTLDSVQKASTKLTSGDNTMNIGVVVGSVAEARQVAEELGFPVRIKTASYNTGYIANNDTEIFNLATEILGLADISEVEIYKELSVS